jgi:hypothetical protein
MKRHLLITALVGIGLAFSAVTSAEEGAASVKTTDSARVGVIGGQTVVEYRFTDVAFKPYVRAFTTPGGLNVLRDSPADHVHHHALMFAVKVDGVNFWEEYPDRKPGSQIHERFLSDPIVSDGDGGCLFDLGAERIDWKAPDGRALLEETRHVRVRRSNDAAKDGSVLTWTSRLALPEGRDKAVLTGSHYHGLGVRFPTSMDRVGTHFNAAGKMGPVYRGSERLTETKWTAYTAPVEGKPVTVAVFDDPKNPRPAVMFTMLHGFAYISATLDLEKRPLTIEAGTPLELRYGVVAWDGKKSAEEVEAAYGEWVEP